jgi:hypothetical protein
MIRNAVRTGAINAKFAKLISPYKIRSYDCGAKVLEMDHTGEVAGSSPVSPSGVNQVESYA